MNIQIDSLIAGADRAVGVAVIIDVFRAFTTAAVALANGATKIVMVRDVEEALRLRAAGVGELCMGEVGGRAPPGFDLGNSPFEVSEADLEGRTIIQRTSAGTQGIVAAKRATRLYAGSLLTAGATTRAILRQAPPDVTLVAMGLDGARRSDEDELCAIHLRNLLQGRLGSPSGTRDVILAGPQIPAFHDPAKPHLHPADLDIALEIDRYDFAVLISREGGRLIARKELV
ncbi:2-phosphosulfolactate phosphatase [Bradyrhizobium sp. 61]|uniref:2-phosphosulfolactate phosphatase n=1 Tax=unclassified Bradyrhizobium TaxID=2631580 RepID=UPI001FF738AF|nr:MULTISPECIES: 2-phosphosulfolactate phosphatase [unclassified Bradyrhizobium]MCK1274663.1 2-phosphosulfolactate phosphatase [Bradyrhizobium sp. 61]MCK1441657.1 2-phosphosulfolactate phosphatase [Bradyrhizobium sp. 48]MCK1465199.1 2-phosphosulfolactate phosphatase [Bradyrhizobium sp. 2]